MARSVKLSADAARTILGMEKRTPGRITDPAWAFEELRRALARLDRAPTKARPKRKPAKYSLLMMRRSGKSPTPFAASNFAHPSDVPSPVSKKAEKRERRQTVWAACWARAGVVCECGCGRPALMSIGAGGQMDHFWGRGKGRQPESVETCWILRADCHREKTNSYPDAATWLRKFLAHARKHGYSRQARYAEDRLAFVETRASLPAAPALGRTP